MVAGGLGDQVRLIQELVALQHPFLVPGRAVQGEVQAGARPALLGLAASSAPRPALQRRADGVVEQGGAAAPPVLPREEPGPRRPGRVRRLGLDRFGGEGQITHRDHPRRVRTLDRAHVGHGRIAAAVAESIELLHIAEIEAGLLGHERPQRQFEGASALRIEGAERQAHQGGWPAGARVVRTHGEHHRLAVADGDDHGREADDDRGGHPEAALSGVRRRLT